MKRYTKLSTYTLLLLLCALVFLTSSGAAGLYSHDQVRSGAGGSGQSSGPVYGPWGPPVGREPSGETVKLAPLAIGDEMSDANATIVSDDFNTCGLDTELWEFINPLDDGSAETTGTFTDDAWLEIEVPSEFKHDIWLAGNFAPRVMQSVTDPGDFEVEAKWESRLTKRFQMQGILIEAFPDQFLRFEFYGDEEQVWAFAAILEPGITDPLTATVKYNQPVYSKWQVPLYMRVRRQGDLWTQYRSLDGEAWELAAAFAYPLTVRAVGTYGANAGKLSTPGHTAQVDYFFNTNSPIVPEDGDRNILTLNVVGNGTVDVSPDKRPGSYDCNELVTLTPTGAPGWLVEWSGPDASDLIDNGDGTWSLAMDGDKEVTATFTKTEFNVTVTVVGQGTVINTPGNPYPAGQVATLRPLPNPGWGFAGWSGPNAADLNDEGNGTWSLLMDEDKEVTATFVTYRVFLPIILR
jgi:hypothetical protein